MRVPPSGSAAAALDDADLLVLAGEFHAAPDLFDGLAEGIALYRCDGSVVTGNRASRRMVGRTAHDLIGRHFSIHVAPSELERVAALHMQLIENEEPVSFETKFIHADGSLIDVAVRLLPARSRGRLVGVLGIAQDLTAQRRSERALEVARERFHSFFDAHPDMVAMIGAGGVCLGVNRATETVLGYAASELAGEPASLFVDPTSASAFDRALDHALGGESAEFSITARSKDGAGRRLDVTSIPIVAGGVSEGMFCVCRDVTARSKSEADFSMLAARIHQLYLLAAATGATPEEQIAAALRLGMTQLGFDWGYVAQAYDDHISIAYSQGDDARFAVGHTQARSRTIADFVMRHDGPFVVPDLSVAEWARHPARLANGWESYVGNQIRVGDQVYGAVIFASRSRHAELGDLDREYVEAIARLAAFAIERALQSDQLRGMAFYDGLTALPNRVLLQDRLEQLISLARRQKRAFAVHFIDFDGFKAVNDTHGHGVGDKLIVAMGARLSDALRESDTLARLGGDEFVILQPEIVDADAAVEFASRLLAEVRRPFSIDGIEISITLSIGIAMFPHDGTTVEELLSSADTALYAVKNSGRDNCAVYEASMKPKVR